MAVIKLNNYKGTRHFGRFSSKKNVYLVSADISDAEMSAICTALKEKKSGAVVVFCGVTDAVSIKKHSALTVIELIDGNGVFLSKGAVLSGALSGYAVFDDNALQNAKNYLSEYEIKNSKIEFSVTDNRIDFVFYYFDKAHFDRFAYDITSLDGISALEIIGNCPPSKNNLYLYDIVSKTFDVTESGAEYAKKNYQNLLGQSSCILKIGKDNAAENILKLIDAVEGFK